MGEIEETPKSSQDTATDTPAASIDPATSSAVSGVGAASDSVGMFKKRTRTTSAQKGNRKPISTIPSTAPTFTISDDDSEYENSDDDQNARPSEIIAGRKRKRGNFIQATSSRKPATKEDLGVSYDANKNSEAYFDPKSQATAVSAEFNEAELLGRTKQSTTIEPTSDNLYRGQKGYRTLVPKREQITTKYNSMGPQKAASNVRMTTVTDYAPGMFLRHGH
jgi:hypothetical protein